MQVSALEEAGCKRVFVDVASGRRGAQRPQLEELLAFARVGDEVAVWKLDRAARSLSDLLRFMERLEDGGIQFRSLTEGVETSTAAGRMLASMLGAFAQYERELIRERTREGLEEARKRGTKLGRPKALTPSQAELARKEVASGRPIAAVARDLSVGWATVQRAVRSGACLTGRDP